MTTGEVQGDASESQQLHTDEDRRSATPTDINIAMRCVLKNDAERLTRCFEDEEDPFKDRVAELITERDEHHKSPLDMAAILGRVDVMKELVARGADVGSATGKGYAALHHAAAWGRIECLKLLVENGADLQSRTSSKERSRELALRYSQAECVDFLDWAEAKQNLQKTITTMQETITDPEKVQGRLSRDDKTTTTSLIKEKTEWLENSVDTTTQDFITQKQEFDEAMAPILQKLSEPPAKESQKSQKRSN